MIPMSARANEGFKAVEAALNSAPDVLDKHMIPALDRWALETVREAQKNASEYDGFGFNRSAIHSEKPSKYERVVATGTNYAIYLEEGIKPNQPRMPDVAGLMPWVRQKNPGQTPYELDRSVYLIARSIQKHGIKARPYMAPTAETMIPRGAELMGDAVLAAIEEIGHA